MGKWKQEFSILKRKMPLSLSNSIGFAQFPLLKVRELWEHLVKKTHFWGIRGGMIKMTILQKKSSHRDMFFLNQS